MEGCYPECQQYENQTNPLCVANDPISKNHIVTSTCIVRQKFIMVCGFTGLPVPQIKNVHYVTYPEVDFRRIVLRWTPTADAKFYVIQYAQVNDNYTWSNGSLSENVKEPFEHFSHDIDLSSSNFVQLTTELNITVIKNDLCHEYEFRVAAVYKTGISNFSNTLILESKKLVTQF